MRARARWRVGAAALVATMAIGAPSRADESVGAGGGAAGAHAETKAPSADSGKARCIEAHATAQRALLSRRVSEARAAVRACLTEECPAVLRAECTEMSTRIEAAAPTLTVAVRDARGLDLMGARVFVDDVELPQASGAEVEPGPRRIRVVTTDGRERGLEIVVRIGEKNRVVTVEIDDPPTPNAQRAQLAEAPPAKPATTGATSRVLPWVLTAASVTALGVGTAAGISGLSQQREMERTCVPLCSSNAVTQMRTAYVIADIGWIVGAVAGAAAIYTWVR